MTAGSIDRIVALAAKDLAELRRNPAAILPPIFVALASMFPAFLLAVVVPRLTGERLADASDLTDGARIAEKLIPELRGLDPDALVQAFIFHQFILLLLIVAVVGSMALAAHAVIGEKLARTLEPLLATPLSTVELLIAKTLSPLALSTLILWVSVALFIGGVALVGEPGTAQTLLGARTLVLFFVVGPLVCVVSLLLAVIVSSRVNDARSAQQIAALVVLPITGVFLASLLGQFVMGLGTILVTAVGLTLLAGVLMWAGVRVFDRESILMRWK